MPLYADATALKALGLLGVFHLLPHFDGDVVIPNSLLYELGIIKADVAQARANGWLRIEPHSDSAVAGIMSTLELDRGEAELFDLIANSPTTNNTVLLDEGRAYGQLSSRRAHPPIFCLADVLTYLEAHGHLSTTAAQLMQTALANEYYFWAWNVKRDYLARCSSVGINPLPT